MEGAVALVLALLAIPFVLPIVSWVMARRARLRIDELEARLELQDDRITTLSNQLALLKKEGAQPRPAAPEPEVSAPPVVKTPPVVAPPPAAPVRPPLIQPPPIVTPPIGTTP